MSCSKVRVLLIVFTLLSACGAAVAEDASPDLPTDRPLSLQECIEYALQWHSSVLSAERDLVGSTAEVTRAHAGYMPRISVGSQYTSSGITGGVTANGYTYARDTGYSGTESTIGVSETMFDGGRTLTAIRQASASRRAVSADLELARQQRVLEVTTAYFNALRTKRLADIAAQTVAESEEQRKLIQARIDEGDAAPIDIYPVDVQLANARLNKLQAENNARVAGSALRNTIGLDRGPELRLIDVQGPSDETQSLDECLTRALSDRPEIVRSVAQVDSSRAGVSLAKLQALPVLTANAGYDRGLGGIGYDSQWSVGVGLTMSIFDGGATAAGITSAKAKLDSLVLRDGQVRKDIATEIEEAYLNLTSAFERLAASKPNVDLARKNLEVAREKYRQGLGIPLEIVTAQVSYADAQASHAQALYDCYVARAQLDKATGKRGY